MEPETKPSWRSRIAGMRKRLLQILGIFWSSLVSFFSYLHRDFKEFIDYIHPKNDTENASASPAEKPTIIADVVPSPPAYEKREKTRYIKTPWHDTLVQWFTFFTVLAYTFVSFHQWKTTERQLEGAERPWLNLQRIIINEPGITFAPNGDMLMTVRPVIENIGHSVATNVSFNAILILPKPEDIPIAAQRAQTKLCGTIEKQPVEVNAQYILSGQVVIFPNATNDTSSWTGLNLTKEIIKQNQVVVPIDGKAEGALIPMLVGCIDYLYLNSGRHHQTRFAYDVRNGFAGAIIANSNVPRDRIVLSNNFFGGFSAD